MFYKPEIQQSSNNSFLLAKVSLADFIVESIALDSLLNRFQVNINVIFKFNIPFDHIDSLAFAEISF